MKALQIINTIAGSVFLASLLLSCGSQTRETNDSTSLITNEKQQNLEIKTGIPTVIDFNATWCTPCKNIEPLYRELEKQYNGQINFESVDVDQQPQVAQDYKVEAMPTFVFLDSEGNEVDRLVGAIPDSLKIKIKKLID